MPNDLQLELTLLQEQASRLGQVIAEAQLTTPAQAKGTDPCGAVRVRLGPDGLPGSIRVAGNWNRRVSGDEFAAAVVEACLAAARERMAVWTATLEREGWLSRVEQLRGELDQPAGTASAPVGGNIPAAFARPYPGRPRPAEALAEDALSAFDAAARAAVSPPGPPQGCGHGAGGRLVLTLSASALVSCEADPGWVSGQTATALTSALGEALTAARASLAGALAAQEDDTRRRSAGLREIFDEALDLISNENRFPSRNGDHS